MSIAILSTYDLANGSGRAAYRLHQGLCQLGLESHLCVQEKTSPDIRVTAPNISLVQGIAKAKISLDALPLKLYKQRQGGLFSLQWLPDRMAVQLARMNLDLINLHWINGAYIQIETLAKFRKPLVWTLHDMWAFTGGCHYNQNCDRYLASCGSCPQLGSQSDWDLSRWVWQRKAKAWKHLDLTVVALSSWLAKAASSSSLFRDVRVELIPNGIDTQIYRPLPKQVARELLGLPQDKQLVLFGALKATGDPRKGFHLLQPALKSLSQSVWQDRFELVIFGATRPEQPPEFGFPTHYLGTFSDDLSLVLIYSAADVFVAPSTQENLANTVMEATACGTPCVAFNIGGMPDMIEHQCNGYLAQPYNIEDLAQGIAWVLESATRYQKLCDRSRQKVEQEFTRDLQAQRYAALFAEVVNLSVS
jgi:glycosyltransferase involved in cell wall biosynthesis